MPTLKSIDPRFAHVTPQWLDEVVKELDFNSVRALCLEAGVHYQNVSRGKMQGVVPPRIAIALHWYVEGLRKDKIIEQLNDRLAEMGDEI